MSCTKRPYTYRGACDELLRAKCARVLRHSQKRRECRIYACRECGSWHLTSSPGRNEEDVA